MGTKMCLRLAEVKLREIFIILWIYLDRNAIIGYEME